MFCRVLISVIFLGYLAYIQGDPITDVVDLYQPSLLRLKTFYTDRYTESNSHYNTLVTQLNIDLAAAKTEANLYITTIKNATAAAKTKAASAPVALACIKAQENTVLTLTNSKLTSCSAAANLTELKTIKEGFSTLTTVATNAIAYCKNLNPLPIQADSLRLCLVTKIADLLERVAVLENNYNTLSNATLVENTNCLATVGGALLSQIGSLNYEINLCLLKI